MIDSKDKAASRIAAVCCVALPIMLPACGMFYSGDPEREQARVIAVARSAKVAEGAAEAAEGQRRDGSRDCPPDEARESPEECGRDEQE